METNIFADTYTPNETELNTCKHIVLSSPHEWNPRTVTFNNSAISFEEAMMTQYNVSALTNGAITNGSNTNGANGKNVIVNSPIVLPL